MTTLPVPVTTLHDLHAWMKALHSALFLVHNAMSAEELRKARDELVKLREPLDRKYKSPVDLHGGINQHIDDELVELSRVKRWTKKDLKHKRDFAKRCIDLLADMLMAQPFGYHEIYSPKFQYKVAERRKQERDWLNSVFEPIMQLHHLVLETTPAKTKQSRAKKSHGQGDAKVKLIAALTKHHQYADGSCLNTEPVGNNKLARSAGVSNSAASKFIQEQFKGYSQYKVICRDPHRLIAALRILNNEYAPHILLGENAASVPSPSGDDE